MTAQNIIHDQLFLSQKSTSANRADLKVAEDLRDTLLANRDKAVGLAANMIGKNKIADKKFNNFRVFDIIEALLKVRLYLFNTGRDKEKKARETFDIFDNNDKYRYDDLLYKYPEIEDNIKDLFKYYEFNEYLPLLNKDLNEYIKLNTKMGYSAMGLFKYNKYLSSYIQSINYKIPTTIGEY